MATTAPTLPPNAQQVIAALHALSTPTAANGDRSVQLAANDWLTSFQHSKEAWETCHVLLFDEHVGLDVKMFAGQTFRAKVIYDIGELDELSLQGLRTSLLTALRRFSAPGFRPILIQVCLALADLAVQMMSWSNVVHGLIADYGQDVAMVPALLEFLRVLPEEAGNPKIVVASDEMERRLGDMMGSSAQEVLGLLAMYIVAPGIDRKIQAAVFSALRSWLVAGELTTSQIAQTPLFQFTFEALANDSLFDTAVDVLVDLIHETQEIDDNLAVIQEVLPRVLALAPRLQSEDVRDDPEALRGFCRIFVEAGETYRPLILQHAETFFPLVQAIAICARSEELEIVKITFNFWYKLAQSLGKRPSDAFSRPFAEIYSGLVEVIIGHLRFPADEGEMNAQERDDFRSFRHTMGDTLKDCCYVLGSTECLKRSFELIQGALQTAAAPEADAARTWQAIEAPLFSLRSMGAEVDPNDSNAVPLIMSLLPSLPAHPKVQYAAILVIGRYTEWIDQHPEHMEFCLQYVSKGFESADKEVAAASAQSMRYLCKDCKQHLVPYLPQLYSFLTTIGPSLSPEDVIQVTEAVAFVLSYMPVDEVAAALRTFAMPLVQNIHDLSTATHVGRDEITSICISLEQLETFLAVLRTLGPGLPPSCAATPAEVWAVIDGLLNRFGSNWQIAERSCALLRRAITFFGPAARSVVPAVIDRLSTCFEESQISGYLWITGKLGTNFGVAAEGGPPDEEIVSKVVQAWERETQVFTAIVNRESATSFPDVMDDYVHLLLELLPLLGDRLISSPAFTASFKLCLAALSLPSNEIVMTSLDFIQTLLGQPPSAQLGATLTECGQDLLGLVLGGLVTGYPEDSTGMVVGILRTLAGLFPQLVVEALPTIVDRLPASSVPAVEKQAFLTKFATAMSTPNPDLVKPAVIALYRASRRSRDRLRNGARPDGGDSR